ncbi:MAG: hypothetical protein KatS3mg031_1538 [Chitinophagales bacterium]|nr:MAG: hypothetical protein KatS3mg031_1538 [Chitinophagales bacterium]
MTLTALLPMKGHSERVPNKNLKLFAGRPLYHHVMRTLLGCPAITRIVINTDSAAIAEDVKRHFPETLIIERPEAIRGDMVPMNKIIAHDIAVTGGTHFVQTHSTNPLLKPQTLQSAIDFYFSHLHEYDSLFSVTRLQTRLYWQDGRPVNHNPNALIRTQDLPVIYEENSNFYLFSATSFRQNDENRIGRKPFLFETPKLESLDIDEPHDFELAEMIFLKQTAAK